MLFHAHALRDNDIRHIRNSHGEKTKEKYPVTKQDIKNIPWIVENYDKVYTIKRRDGKTGLVYVTVNNQGTVYYLEQVTSKYGNEPLLINKQMIKTGIGDIPGLPGLKEAITKKQSETEFLNDLRKAQQVYAQSVYQSHSNVKVTQTDTNVNDQNSLSAQRQADAGNVSKVGWDGRVAVTEAKGPNITIDGVTYKLLGLDKNGSKVYQDVEVLKEQSKQAAENNSDQNSREKEFINLEDYDIMELNRESKNTGAFADLPERMSKKHIRLVAKEYGIPLDGIHLNIDTNQELLRIGLTGRVDPEHIGGITFFPNAFRSKEELLRTLFHEKVHVKQFKEFGVEFVQNNRAHFEELAYAEENKFIEKLKKAGKL